MTIGQRKRDIIRVGDIVWADRNALLVRYAGQGETEQANLLAKIGRVAVLSGVDLSRSALSDAIRKALARPGLSRAVPIAIDGAGSPCPAFERPCALGV